MSEQGLTDRVVKGFLSRDLSEWGASVHPEIRMHGINFLLCSKENSRQPVYDLVLFSLLAMNS